MKIRYGMMRIVTVLLVAGLVFSSCSDLKNGTVVIQLPGGARALSPDIINTLRFRIDCKGPGPAETVNARPGDSVSIMLVEGTWTITVTVFNEEGKEVGAGSQEAVVAAGKMTTVTIPITIEKDDDNGGGDEEQTLQLSGQVYRYNDGAYQPYTGTGSITVNSPAGGNGTITANGMLSFSIGTPLQLTQLSDILQGDILEQAGFTANVSGASGAIIYHLRADSFTLSSEYEANDYEQAVYLYIDRDLSITGTEMSFSFQNFNFTYNEKTLNLRSGWNVLYVKMGESIQSMSYTFSDINPGNLYWVLHE